MSSDVLPRRNLGPADYWGQVVEARLQAVSRRAGISDGTLAGLGRGRASSLADMARRADLLQGALEAMPVPLQNYGHAAGFGVTGDWRTVLASSLVAPPHKSSLNLIVVGGARTWDIGVAPGPSGVFVWPFDPRPIGNGGDVSSEYGPRTGGSGTFHEGIDFAPGAGATIRAAGDGVVQDAYYHTNFGNMVILHHGTYGSVDLKTLYAHMNAPASVSVGQTVTAGNTILGYVGSTGASFGAHLHWETHLTNVGGSIHWNLNANGDDRTAANPRWFMDNYGEAVVGPTDYAQVSCRIVVDGVPSLIFGTVAKLELDGSTTYGSSHFYPIYGTTKAVTPGQVVTADLQLLAQTPANVPPHARSYAALSMLGVFS